MFGSELVDVLCIGSGSAGLAAAIAAADAGMSVFVAESRRRSSPLRPIDSADSWTSVLQRHWGVDEFDMQTAAYLDELTYDLGPPVRSCAQGHLPIGPVASFDGVEVDPKDTVAPFYGHELARWARDCLTSPYGMVFSRVPSSLMMTPLQMRGGTEINAGVIAEVPPDRQVRMTLRQWLRNMAKEKGITVHGSSTAQRLLFDYGHLVGAIIDTPGGVRHVRARRGVVLGTSDSTADDLLAMYPATILQDYRLSGVGRSASRFARLELLSTAENSAARAPRTVGLRAGQSPLCRNRRTHGAPPDVAGSSSTRQRRRRGPQ